MQSLEKERIIWIDRLKLFACLLVVLGHLYMSMTSGEWISENSVYYCLPIQTIYTFHVPIFFVCSGFLYQNKKGFYNLNSHFDNIKKKALNLGVPYLVFSILTLVLKIVFSDSVNNQSPSIIKTILWEPIAPYWYLYTLFFLFCLIPRQSSNSKLTRLFLISIIVKVGYVFVPWQFDFPDIIVKISENAIWFCFGMELTNETFKKKVENKRVMIITFCGGIFLSLLFYHKNCGSRIIQFLIAILFVYFFICLFQLVVKGRGNKLISSISKYFMPVYLMHTIFAAGVRILLLKIGVTLFIVHFTAGLLASIFFPILIYVLAEKKWWLLFWIEPSRALKMKRIKNV